jgi:glutaconate CoA-transferase, subunit A
VAVGGYLQQNVPMRLLAALADRGVRDLTVVAAPSASLGVEFLIAAGCVSRVICPYVAFEGRGPAPAFSRGLSEGTVERVLCDQTILLTGLRAAAQAAPCGVFPPSGSEVEADSPLVLETTCPFTGDRLLAVRRLDLDVALLHAQRADSSGNLLYYGAQFLDLMFAQAGRCVVAQVDELSTSREEGAPAWTPLAGVWVDAVVHEPGGASPTASHGLYGEDATTVSRYLSLESEQRGGGADWLVGTILDRTSG